MTSEEQFPRLLTQAREERELTQADAAEQLAKVAWLHKRQHVGVNADMVSKWERGVKRPSKLYRELLCLLYGRSPGQLGFAKQTPVVRVAEPQVGPSTVEAALFETLLGTTHILDQLGPDGAVVQPKMYENWKEDLMKRRALLKLVGLTSAAGAFPGLAPASLPRRPTADRSTADALDGLADRYQRLYHSAPPVSLMTPVLAHLETVSDVIRETSSPADRRRLFGNRARVATLAGRLSFFDLHDPMAARGYYNLALEAAREADDHLQAAAALGHVAFIPAAESSYSASLDYIRGAAHHVSKSPHGPVSSWLAAVESEMQTSAGNEHGALSAIDRARDALTRNGLTEPLPWFDYYDSTRLDGFAGYALLRFGHLDQAHATLHGAAASLPGSAVKQRAVFLADLATVALRRNELNEACDLAGQAADQLISAGYATGADRLREFRGSVEPWKDHPGVKVLDERLALMR